MALSEDPLAVHLENLRKPEEQRMLLLSRRKALSHILLGTGAVLLAPEFLLAEENAFDLALRGQDLLAEGNYSEAIRALKRAATIDPGSEWAWGLLGRAYYQSGDMRNSLDSFRQVLKINPEDTYSRMMVDIITQKPVPPKREEVKPLSKLEQQALEEEKKFFGQNSGSSELGYQIRRIVLDAGHGGFDTGAIGPSGLQEKDLNLDLVQRTAANLAQMDSNLKVFLSRTEDYYMPLSARTTFANQYSADLFLSFHVNASKNSKAHGMETFFCSEKASSKEAARVASFENSVLKYDKESLVRKGYVDIEDILFRFERRRYWEAGGEAAKSLQNVMVKSLVMRNRGVNSANFYVLRRATMPSVLLETGFITNPENERLLGKPEERSKISQIIASSIVELSKGGIKA